MQPRPQEQLRVFFAIAAVAILLFYVYILYLAFQQSSFTGAAILLGLPLIIMHVILLLTWRAREKRKSPEKALIYKAPELREEN